MPRNGFTGPTAPRTFFAASCGGCLRRAVRTAARSDGVIDTHVATARDAAGPNVAVCRALGYQGGSKFGRLNSTVDDDTQEIVQHKGIHLGIATDTESGLMVPVIRHAERMGVLELICQPGGGGTLCG